MLQTGMPSRTKAADLMVNFLNQQCIILYYGARALTECADTGFAERITMIVLATVYSTLRSLESYGVHACAHVLHSASVPTPQWTAIMHYHVAWLDDYTHVTIVAIEFPRHVVVTVAGAGCLSPLIPLIDLYHFLQHANMGSTWIPNQRSAHTYTSKGCPMQNT
jgi:hypothetical protein